METKPERWELLTDLYELTMAAAYYDHGMTAPATFSLFIRDYPPHRSYFVNAGLDDVLAYLESFRFSEEDVRRLRAALKDTPAVQNGRVLRVDGRDLTWNGVRTFQALATLPAAFHASTDGGMGVADAPVGESE